MFPNHDSGPETERNLLPTPHIWKSPEDESAHSQGSKNKLLIKATRAFWSLSDTSSSHFYPPSVILPSIRPPPPLASRNRRHMPVVKQSYTSSLLFVFLFHVVYLCGFFFIYLILEGFFEHLRAVWSAVCTAVRKDTEQNVGSVCVPCSCYIQHSVHLCSHPCPKMIMKTVLKHNMTALVTLNIVWYLVVCLLIFMQSNEAPESQVLVITQIFWSQAPYRINEIRN